MARNCCGTASCGCKVVAGTGTVVTGTGTVSDPYVIDAELILTAGDTSTINMTLLGTGTSTDPYVLSADMTGRLNDLADVDTTGQTAGRVLGFDGSAWKPVAATTAPTGAITHDTALVGDGSVGTPLGVNEDPARMLGTTAAGLGLSDIGMNSIVRHYTDAVARNAATPTPVLNTLSVLDSKPGQVDYWTGSVWAPVNQFKAAAGSHELMALSGSWNGQAITTLFKQEVSLPTDATGAAIVLSAGDLTGYAGVMSCTVTPTGANPWVAVLAPQGNSLVAFIYLLTTGAPFPNESVSATITAWLY